MESCPLYWAPKAYSLPPFLSLNVWCALLLHYLPWCIHWKWPYTSVNMSSHWWWHPKSLTSTPLPHCGTPQHQWAALRFLWWLSIILDNVSQWQSRHHSKVIFTPTVGHVHVSGRESDGEGWKLHHPLAGGLFIRFSLSLPVSLLLYLKDTRNRKGHCTFSHFRRYVELPVGWHKNVPIQMSRIRSP